MPAKRKKKNEPGGSPKKPAHNGQREGEMRPIGHIITAKDAGWITPTAFVLPVKLVPIDPPRPLKKRRRDSQ